jgi:hypothetical protein
MHKNLLNIWSLQILDVNNWNFGMFTLKYFAGENDTESMKIISRTGQIKMMQVFYRISERYEVHLQTFLKKKRKKGEQ